MERLGIQRPRRWLAPAVVGICALAAAASAFASHPILTRSSTFDSTNEGWVGQDNTGFHNMTWQGSGGNPNGYINITFASGGGDIQSVPNDAGSTWPAGNALGDYGGTLAADVRVHLNGATSTEDLVIGFFSSNASALACEDLGAPTSSWATYTVTLDVSHLISCSTGKPLTGPQASADLAGFEGIVVGAGNLDNVGEVVDVDNATLAGPQAGQTPPTGTVSRALTLTYKAHKLSGALTAADDFSCAAKTKVTIFEKAKKPVKVGTATTSAANQQVQSGPATFTFKLKKSEKGKFYASAGKTTSKLDGNKCRAATSKSVTVR